MYHVRPDRCMVACTINRFPLPFTHYTYHTHPWNHYWTTLPAPHCMPPSTVLVTAALPCPNYYHYTSYNSKQLDVYRTIFNLQPRCLGLFLFLNTTIWSLMSDLCMWHSQISRYRYWLQPQSTCNLRLQMKSLNVGRHRTWTGCLHIPCDLINV